MHVVWHKPEDDNLAWVADQEICNRRCGGAAMDDTRMRGCVHDPGVPSQLQAEALHCRACRAAGWQVGELGKHLNPLFRRAEQSLVRGRHVLLLLLLLLQENSCETLSYLQLSASPVPD